MIESQIDYAVGAIRIMRGHSLRTLEVRQDAQDEFNARVQARLADSVWNTGGCASWYLDKHGNNPTIWPGFTYTFHRLTREFDLDAYATARR
ncbi:hypothetical protein [Nocardia crassostreae]|uniref:hypothetical protein n=1 Tax=Nocardia crassostreae TaxID=53428 RepID=UPI000B19FB31